MVMIMKTVNFKSLNTFNKEKGIVIESEFLTRPDIETLAKNYDLTDEEIAKAYRDIIDHQDCYVNGYLPTLYIDMEEDKVMSIDELFE